MSQVPLTASPDPRESVDLTVNRRRLFLIGFLVLFLELACIRWFGAYVLFLQFFTNLILIAAFLGMSIGCVCADARTDWLRRFGWLSLGTMGLAVGLNLLYRRWEGLTIDVQSASPEIVFFGTEYRDVDIAQFIVPVEVIAGVFFVLVTLMFIGLGQVLGRAFDRDPNRVVAYTFNIAGSLAGILGFAVVSFAETPPVVWFAIGLVGVGYLLQQRGRLTRPQIGVLGLTALLILGAGLSPYRAYQVFWSPYYWLIYHTEGRRISVGNINHQSMHTRDTGGVVYSLIHLLRRDAGDQPFEDVLIIGAGSGNDVAHALAYDVTHIDAVEIDPVIHRLGVQYHPERPYDDPRVDVHLDDGRRVLRRTDRQYDLVIYGLVDSLILHSSYSSIRLESFLFTEEAFRDVKAALAPGGVFVTYNYFRQGWIVHRIAAMLETVFGHPPLVLSLPYLDAIRADGEDRLRGYTMIVAGDTTRIAAALPIPSAAYRATAAAPAAPARG